jgi:hypothetical protein
MCGQIAICPYMDAGCFGTAQDAGEAVRFQEADFSAWRVCHGKPIQASGAK